MSDPKTIISWDVGVRNLAYCILRKVPGKDMEEILEWDSINLLHQETHVCCGTLKKGNACSQKAGYVLVTPEQTYYLCTRHSKTSDHLWCADHLDACYRERLGSLCQYVARTGTKCTAKAKHRYRNEINLCTSHKRVHRNRCQKEFSVRKITRETVSNVSTAELQLRMYRALDAMIPMLVEHDVSEMIIENQPAMKSSGMKAFATSLFSWAVIRGQVDCLTHSGSRQPGDPVLGVKFVSASGKMKLSIDSQDCTGQDIVDAAQQEGGASEPSRYKITKKTAVDHTRERISDSPHWSAVLDSFPKPDDPCDAYLQGVQYLER